MTTCEAASALKSAGVSLWLDPQTSRILYRVDAPAVTGELRQLMLTACPVILKAYEENAKTIEATKAVSLLEAQELAFYALWIGGGQ